MGVPSLNDLAVDGTLNTTNQPTKLHQCLHALILADFQKIMTALCRSHIESVVKER